MVEVEYRAPRRRDYDPRMESEQLLPGRGFLGLGPHEIESRISTSPKDDEVTRS